MEEFKILKISEDVWGKLQAEKMHFLYSQEGYTTKTRLFYWRH